MLIDEIKGYNLGSDLALNIRLYQGRYTARDLRKMSIKSILNSTVKNDTEREIAKFIADILL